MKSKAQERWELKKQLNAYLKRGGVVTKLKTGIAWNWHPYDYTPIQALGFIDGHFQVKDYLKEGV